MSAYKCFPCLVRIPFGQKDEQQVKFAIYSPRGYVDGAICAKIAILRCIYICCAEYINTATDM